MLAPETSCGKAIFATFKLPAYRHQVSLVRRKQPKVNAHMQYAAVSPLVWVLVTVPALVAAAPYNRSGWLIISVLAFVAMCHVIYQGLTKLK